MIESWQQPAWDLLVRRHAEGRLPHGLLLHGPAGVGKRSVASQFTALVLCASPRDGRACGVCRGCTLLAAGTHPDHHRIGLEEDSRQIRVDAVREVSRKAALTSSEGGYQVFVVDPADRMNVNAANAFLKTLEEPRPGTLLLLVAEAPTQLPITVLSRCQQVAIALPSTADATAWLERATPAATTDERQLALEAAGGSPGVAARLLEDGHADAYPETLRDLDALASGDTDPISVAQRWAESLPALRLAWMSRALREAGWRQVGVASKRRTGLTAVRDLASLSSLEGATNRARRLLESNLRPELLIESLLLDWMRGKASARGGRSW